MENKGLRVNRTKQRYWYVVLNLFRVGSQVASGRVVYVVKGLTETQFFVLSVGSGYIKDVME